MWQLIVDVKVEGNQLTIFHVYSLTRDETTH